MKTRFTLRINEELLKDLKIIAINKNTSLSDLIVFELKNSLLTQGLISIEDFKRYDE